MVKNMDVKQFKTTNVGGIKTACITRKELTDIILSAVTTYRIGRRIEPYLVFDSNGHGISLANTSSKFKKALAMADIVHADGQSVVTMSKWVRGETIPKDHQLQI